MSTLSVESTRFGTLEIEADTVIEFPTGLIGLGGSRYALLAAEEDAAFVWLHSVEDPDLALPVTNPWLFYSDYVVEISDEETRRTGLDPDGAAVWVTVRAGDQLGDFTANLRAPILVREGRGHQVINEAPEAPVRAPLFPSPVVAA
jgi:flagellar assembly factor FliW